ncbi:UNVERIFIED_CONTAM: hypothetical protein Slati_2203400 [Sesamum latifolium]|uniref:Uncharacterized protein n=1 Tax=Sesamum latifolium TaxID=2727402 RepID=A0AAW2WSH9_9LAMI
MDVIEVQEDNQSSDEEDITPISNKYRSLENCEQMLDLEKINAEARLSKTQKRTLWHLLHKKTSMIQLHWHSLTTVPQKVHKTATVTLETHQRRFCKRTSFLTLCSLENGKEINP